MRRRENKNWIRIGKLIIDAEQIVAAELNPDNTINIHVAGSIQVFVIPGSNKAEFINWFRAHAKSKGDKLEGI